MTDPRQEHLDRLRRWRSLPDPDLSLRFLGPMFKQQVAGPHRQLAAVVDLWDMLVPEALRARTRLESLTRGVLRVRVDDSPALYELDRLLRGGVERQLITGFKGGSLRRVLLRLGPSTPSTPTTPTTPSAGQTPVRTARRSERPSPSPPSRSR